MRPPSRHRHRSRHGIAVPLVVLFCFCTMGLAVSMFYFRKEAKQLNLMTVNFLQANFLAQAAIEHLVLKCRILPQEAYDAGMILAGYCPLQAVIAGSNPSAGMRRVPRAMNIFIGDCNSTAVPWRLNRLATSNPGWRQTDWRYEVASMSVISAFSDLVNKKFVITVQVIASGSVFDPRGGRGWHTERMTKTLELRREL